MWVVDDMNHVIHKFTNDGKTKVFTLGEMGVFGPNDDLQHFNRPTMIDWLPDGTFFVSDGYANSRVVKYSKEGKPLLWWGSLAPSKKDGEFTVPHGIAVGDDRRVYVSDRFNRQIQVFDENGIFLDKWPSGYCHSLSMSRDQHLWCYDGDHEQFIKYDLRGHIETVFGRYGDYPGATWGVHQIAADSEGNLYGAEVFGGRTQKFVPKPNANPRDLFWGRELAPKTPVTRLTTVRPASASPAAAAKPNPNTPIANFAGTWNFDKGRSQMAGGGGMGSGVGEPPDCHDGEANRERDRDHPAIRVRRAGRGRCECRGARADRRVHGGWKNDSDARSRGCQAPVQLQTLCGVGRLQAGAPDDSRSDQPAGSLGTRRQYAENAALGADAGRRGLGHAQPDLHQGIVETDERGRREVDPVPARAVSAYSRGATDPA